MIFPVAFSSRLSMIQCLSNLPLADKQIMQLDAFLGACMISGYRNHTGPLILLFSTDKAYALETAQQFCTIFSVCHLAVSGSTYMPLFALQSHENNISSCLPNTGGNKKGAV